MRGQALFGEIRRAAWLDFCVEFLFTPLPSLDADMKSFAFGSGKEFDYLRKPWYLFKHGSYHPYNQIVHIHFEHSAWIFIMHHQGVFATMRAGAFCLVSLSPQCELLSFSLLCLGLDFLPHAKCSSTRIQCFSLLQQ